VLGVVVPVVALTLHAGEAPRPRVSAPTIAASPFRLLPNSPAAPQTWTLRASDKLIAEPWQSATLRSVRLDPPKVRKGMPLTGLMLRLTGDSRSLNTDLSLTGAAGAVVNRLFDR
jgi:hypothetical protein